MWLLKERELLAAACRCKCNVLMEFTTFCESTLSPDKTLNRKIIVQNRKNTKKREFCYLCRIWKCILKKAHKQYNDKTNHLNHLIHFGCFKNCVQWCRHSMSNLLKHQTRIGKEINKILQKNFTAAAGTRHSRYIWSQSYLVSAQSKLICKRRPKMLFSK